MAALMGQYRHGLSSYTPHKELELKARVQGGLPANGIEARRG